MHTYTLVIYLYKYVYFTHKQESKESRNLRIRIIRHGRHSLNLYITETWFYDFQVNLFLEYQ